MISEVKLKNWKSHSDSILKFSRGTNALLGPMGSGKSSVMNAICFGLFGTFPDLQSRKIKLDDIIMNKPSVKDESQVMVSFTIEGKNYSVMRVIERDKGTTYSEIREGDKLLDAPNSQRVTEIIEKLLKIDYELFSRAIYSEQNGLDYFLRLPRGERMRRIDNLLMIDRFEQARSGTVTLINRIIERKKAKESMANLDNIRGLEKSLQDIEYSLKNLNKTKLNLSEELGNKETIKEELEKEIKKIEKIDEELNSLKEKKNSIEGSIKEIRSSVEKYSDLLEGKKLDKLKQELREMTELTIKYQKELDKKRETHDILTKDISEKKAKVSFTEKEINELERRIKEKADIKKKIDKIRDDFGDEPKEILKKEKNEVELVKTRMTELKTRLVQVKESLSKISLAEDICPTCESEISEKKRKNLIESFEGKIKAYSKSLVDNKGKLEVKEEKLRTLEDNSRKIELYLERIKGFERDRKQLEEKMKENEAYLEIISKKNEKFNKVKEEISGIETRVENSRKKKQELESLIEKSKDFNKKRLREQELSEKLEKINSEVSDCSKKIEDKDIKEIRRKFTDIVSRVSELMTRVRGIKDIMKEKEERKEEYKKSLDKIKKQKEEIEYLEKLIKDLKIFGSSLERTQSQLRENFIDTVNYTMGQIWSDIYPYEDFMSSRLAIKDRDYILQVQRESGKWVDVEGIVSGGERSIASLVLRMAFSTVLAPQLKWLVLDEPTHNLDSRAIGDLSETLRTKVGEFAEQLFLITHEKRLENAVTGNLYKLFRHRGTSDVTEIKEIN